MRISNIGGDVSWRASCADTTVIALEEPQLDIGLGIRLAFELVSQQS
jgi:hypothetical protein